MNIHSPRCSESPQRRALICLRDCRKQALRMRHPCCLCCLSTARTLTVLSSLPVTARRPSGLICAERTQLVWPLSVNRKCWLGRDQTCSSQTGNDKQDSQTRHITAQHSCSACFER
jgi:hypothetical protein